MNAKKPDVVEILKKLINPQPKNEYERAKQVIEHLNQKLKEKK